MSFDRLALLSNSTVTSETEMRVSFSSISYT